MHPCQRLRLSTLTDLYEFGRKPSVAPTATSEVTDQDIGLYPDPVAQRRAEDFIRAALAYQLKQDDRAQVRRQPLTPVAIRIALAADDEPDDHTMPDVLEALRPAPIRFDG